MVRETQFSKNFQRSLESRNPASAGRQWIYVSYDQLSHEIGPLAQLEASKVGIILIENHSWLGARPYHKQRLAFLISNMRHFALEQADRGVAVEYLVTKLGFRDVLKQLATRYGRILTMEPAEWQLRIDFQALENADLINLLPHEGWLSSLEDFYASQPETPPWRMDSFYRYVRRKTGILMLEGKPLGGKFSFDAENRERWDGDPPAPKVPCFSVDPIKQEVGNLIEGLYNHHPGNLDVGALPATKGDAQELWEWAKRECLNYFGPYEDAMSARSSTLFHTRVSAVLNIHRLLPAQIIAEACRQDIPLNSKEGFVRQILGWREFIRHVHLATEGFRRIPSRSLPILKEVGDGGYRKWSNKAWAASTKIEGMDGGASPSELGASNPLPPAYWGETSGLNCLDSVVSDVWNEGYSHHITRLMILSNIAALLDVSPRELTDWFWIAYTDAYDWVVEPNVLGMGTYALGNLFTTKPYVCGAAYINRMSDYCSICHFDPRRNCPVTRLYWAFLKRHRKVLGSNPRMRLALRSLEKRSAKQVQEDERCFEEAVFRLAKGQPLTPD